MILMILSSCLTIVGIPAALTKIVCGQALHAPDRHQRVRMVRWSIGFAVATSLGAFIFWCATLPSRLTTEPLLFGPLLPSECRLLAALILPTILLECHLWMVFAKRLGQQKRWRLTVWFIGGNFWLVIFPFIVISWNSYALAYACRAGQDPEMIRAGMDKELCRADPRGYWSTRSALWTTVMLWGG